MSTVSLISALTAQRDIGRSRVFYAVTTPGGSTPTQWDGTTELYLKWLCDTEGELVFNPNPSFNRLTAAELTGDAALEAYVQGEAPVINLPAIYADPATRAILSPTFSASGGYPAQQPVLELTMAIFVEKLFWNAVTRDHDLVLDPNGGAWTLGTVGSPVALSAQPDKLRLFNLTTWPWRCFSRKAPFSFNQDSGGKSVQTVEVELMIDQTKPSGHMLYTIGDPYLASPPIDIEGAS
jgi:hypothetical protein